ncbi:MAG TPA: hypothetical protein ENG87_05930 [Candidatus Pacearchaeota archaeon]|nr:hypothetical protein [Candidatus Pacearchaeota archaeon]
MNNSKTILTISRQWHNPKIKVSISNKGIYLQINFDDFVKILKSEIKEKMPFIFKKNTDKKIDNIIENILETVKAESAKII